MSDPEIPEFPQENTRLERYRKNREIDKAITRKQAEFYHLQGLLCLTYGSALGFIFSWGLLGFWWGVGMALMLGGWGLFLMLISRGHLSSRTKGHRK